MFLRSARAARLALATVAFFTVVLAVPRPAIAADQASDVQAELQAKLNSLSNVLPRLEDQTALKKFYESRNYKTVWFDETGPTKAATQVLEALADASAWGLNATDFDLHSQAKDWSGASK